MRVTRTAVDFDPFLFGTNARTTLEDYEFSAGYEPGANYLEPLHIETYYTDELDKAFRDTGLDRDELISELIYSIGEAERAQFETETFQLVRDVTDCLNELPFVTVKFKNYDEIIITTNESKAIKYFKELNGADMTQNDFYDSFSDALAYADELASDDLGTELFYSHFDRHEPDPEKTEIEHFFNERLWEAVYSRDQYRDVLKTKQAKERLAANIGKIKAGINPFKTALT